MGAARPRVGSVRRVVPSRRGSFASGRRRGTPPAPPCSLIGFSASTASRDSRRRVVAFHLLHRPVVQPAALPLRPQVDVIRGEAPMPSGGWAPARRRGASRARRGAQALDAEHSARAGAGAPRRRPAPWRPRARASGTRRRRRRERCVRSHSALCEARAEPRKRQIEGSGQSERRVSAVLDRRFIAIGRTRSSLDAWTKDASPPRSEDRGRAHERRLHSGLRALPPDVRRRRGGSGARAHGRRGFRRDLLRRAQGDLQDRRRG